MPSILSGEAYSGGKTAPTLGRLGICDTLEFETALRNGHELDTLGVWYGLSSGSAGVYAVNADINTWQIVSPYMARNCLGF